MRGTASITIIFLLITELLASQDIPKNPNQVDSTGLRQGKWTITLDKNWEPTSMPDSISFYRLIEYRSDFPIGITRDFYRSGQLQWEGKILADRPEDIMDGRVVWYRKDGTKETVSEYQKGRLISQQNFVLEGSHVLTWAELNVLALKAHKEGDLTLALVQFDNALNQAEIEFGILHKNYALSLKVLASIYNTLGQYTTAEPLYIKAIEIRGKVLGNRHPSYAESINDLAVLYHVMGKFDQAEPLYNKAESIQAKAIGKHHPDYGTTINNLAGLYQSKGNFEKALSHYQRALIIRKTALGDKHIDYANSLDGLSSLYTEMGQFRKAEPLFKEVILIKEDVLDENHPDFALSLKNLAVFYHQYGKYDISERYLLRAVRIEERTIGRHHDHFAISLANLASLYKTQGNLQKAEELFVEAKLILYKSLGDKHPHYASILGNLAGLYEERGDYKKAEPLYYETVEILEKTLGKQHSDYALAISNLAVFYTHRGYYEKAQSLHNEALAIREKVLGKNHAHYAASLQDLAVLFQAQGVYANAELLHLKAMPILAKALGDRHPDYAKSLSDLAGLHEFQGNYSQAEPLFLKSKMVYEEAYGKQHPTYATSLNNLGTLYYTQGDHIKAKQHYLEASNVMQISLGRQHISYAQVLSNLGVLYLAQGDNIKAESLFQEVVVIREKALGKQHPAYAASIAHLASLYKSQGEYKKAMRFYQEAKAVQEKVLGKLHPDYSSTLNSMAILYEALKRFDQAELHYVEAKNIREKVLGKKHPSYALSLSNLAALYNDRQDLVKAIPLFIEALNILLYQIDRNFSHLSEKERGKYFQTFDYNFEAFHSFVIDHAVDNPELLANDFDYLLATKGLLFNSSEKIRDGVLSSNDTAIVRLYNEWQGKGQYVNGLYRVPVQKREERDVNLEEEEEKLNILEKELSARFENFARSRGTVKYTWQDVKDQLQLGEAAVEMVRFRYHKKEWTDSVIYMALIVTPETEGHPELVVLPNGNKLEADYLSAYRRKLKKAHKDTDSYRHYWTPLSEKLKGIKKVYFSADGVYHNISLAGLYNEGDGNYLADKLTIHRVSGTDQLLKEVRERQPMNKAYLVGAPSFNKPGGISEAMEWAALPYTLEEVDTLEHILQEAGITTTVYTKDKATEEEVKNWDNPRVVHLATHAFFLEDKAIKHAQMQSITGLDQSVLFQNPLLRSVMLLANAKGELYGDGTSGALSAKEVLNLKLDQTELVVLSACETGTGVIKNGEGIYGLQRAFLAAGVETVLASLWKVDDEVTKELMTAFYRNWLLEGLTKREAFIRARLRIKNEYGAPRYWAAFVMIGK